MLSVRRVLPLAPRWVRHSYLSKEATIDPLYLWVIIYRQEEVIHWNKLPGATEYMGPARPHARKKFHV